MAERPLGVSILAVLSIIGGIIEIFGGIVMWAMGGFFLMFLQGEAGNMTGMEGAPLAMLGFLQGLLAVISIVVIIFGIIGIIIGLGLWNGKEWARILTIVFSALGILWGILTLPVGIISIIIGVIVIWYLTRPHVVNFFKGVEEAGY